MSKSKVIIKEIVESYSKLIDSCEKFNCFTRSEKNQFEKIKECESGLKELKLYKRQAIELQNEYLANRFFHMQCMLNSMRSSLNMWIELKKQNFHNAWDRLIDAQEYLTIAFKIDDYEGIRNMEKFLSNIENSIFPGWAFYNSPGQTETIGNCSVCNKIFSICDHIENNIYMGQLCRRINIEIIEFHHSSLVERPKNRRCIVTKISNDDGKMIDYFTWEETGLIKNVDEGMTIEGVIVNYHDLDLD